MAEDENETDPTTQLLLSHRASHEMPAKLKSHLLISTPHGMLKIEVSTTSGETDPATGSDPPWILCISSMTAAHERSLGLSAYLTNSVKELYSLKISPTIKTFYVVPLNSAIIRCVSRNDLKGVRTLFETGAASPKDVDPSGFSLLSVLSYTSWKHLCMLI